MSVVAQIAEFMAQWDFTEILAQLVSIVLGVAGIATETKDANHRINRVGRILLGFILLSGLITGLANYGSKIIDKKQQERDLVRQSIAYSRLASALDNLSGYFPDRHPDTLPDENKAAFKRYFTVSYDDLELVEGRYSTILDPGVLRDLEDFLTHTVTVDLYYYARDGRAIPQEDLAKTPVKDGRNALVALGQKACKGFSEASNTSAGLERRLGKAGDSLPVAARTIPACERFK